MNILKRCLVFCMVCFCILANASEDNLDGGIAVTQQRAMKIQNLETIVEKNRILITQEGASYNEVNCAKADAYVISGNKKGFESHRALLISAYLSELPVKLVLKGCSSKRPRIISVTM